MQFKQVMCRKDLQNLSAAYPVGASPSALRDVGTKFANILEELYPDKQIYLFCVGSSGSMLAATISAFLPTIKRIIYVYKDNEDHHKSIHFQSNYKNDKNSVYVFIDDFIETGKTLVKVLEHIRTYYPLLNLNAVLVTSSVYSRILMDYNGNIDLLICGRCNSM